MLDSFGIAAAALLEAGYTATVAFPDVCFVPVASAVDLAEPNDPFAPIDPGVTAWTRPPRSIWPGGGQLPLELLELGAQPGEHRARVVKFAAERRIWVVALVGRNDAAL